MKITIITVCYNSDKTIQKTFDSVRIQNYGDIEYVVIDGGSKDGTVDLIKKNEDIIAYWVSEKDKGLYDAINKGISKATGNYIGILNSDDTFYDENTVKDVAKFIISKPGLDMYLGDIIQHNLSRTLRKYSSAKWKPQCLKKGFMPPHPSVYIKSDLFAKYGNYKLDYIIAADYELFVRYFLKYNLSYAYTGITTTAMLIGGVSSSGIKSYNIITREISKAFLDNRISFSPLRVRTRFVKKILDYFNK